MADFRSSATIIKNEAVKTSPHVSSPKNVGAQWSSGSTSRSNKSISLRVAHIPAKNANVDATITPPD
jgi:hypothetical protein